MAEKQNVTEVADLACLEISNSEIDAFQKNFDQVLEYFGKLASLNTEGVEPMVTPHNIYPELREDRVNNDLSLEEVLENAPDVKDSLFKVPPVV